MATHTASTRLERAVSLLAAVGLASAALASSGDPSAPTRRAPDLVPLHKAGALYINMTTGERTLTLYDAAPAEIEPAHTAALFEYWMSIDENPCWDDQRADGFAVRADSAADNEGPTPITEPIAMWDYGDLPFDSKIAGVVLSTATLALDTIDSNGDGTLDTGIDVVAVFYDGLSDYSLERLDTTRYRSSTAPPTAVVRIASIPGDRNDKPEGPSDYDLVLDFGGNNRFELGDSDGQDHGSLYLPGANPGRDVSEFITDCTTSGTVVNCVTTPNPNADGLADFQYLLYYAKHGTNDKVTDAETFVPLGAPEGTISVTSTFVSGCDPTFTTSCSLYDTTIYHTFFTPNPPPQAQGTFESFGIGALGPGGDTTNIDNSIDGCCFWYGGLDCAGFLNQLVEEPQYNPTYYNFTPYAQLSIGLYTCCDDGFSCLSLDYNGDGILDNGDIGAFLALFLAQDLSTDLNLDGIVDNGDITRFVQVFISCVG